MKEGYIYVFEHGDMLKIGLTQGDVANRVNTWEKVLAKEGKLLHPLKVIYSSPLCAHIYELEKSIHRALDYFRVPTNEGFGKECFRGVNLEAVKSIINTMQKTFTEAPPTKINKVINDPCKSHVEDFYVGLYSELLDKGYTDMMMMKEHPSMNNYLDVEYSYCTHVVATLFPGI